MSSPIPRPTYDPTNIGNFPGDGPLRSGGQTPAALPSGASDLPSAQSASAKRQSPALTLVRDLWDGNEKIHTRGSVYLPQGPGEDANNYRIRLARSVFFNMFQHTILGLTGFVFRRDLVLGDDVPPAIAEHAENIDLTGTHLDVFARELLQDVLTVGHAAILVEFPDTGGAELTLAEEAPLRPYWVPIKKENIVSWRTCIDDGRMTLAQVVLEEKQLVPDGMFGEKERTRYRMLYRTESEIEGAPPVVGFRVLEILPNKIVVEVAAGVYGNQTEIPLVEVASSGRKSLFDSAPPLLDLAYLNVAHYQQWSDYATSLHKTCVPIFVTTGIDDESAPKVLGPNSGINIPNPAGKAEYVSHNGAALGECRAALEGIMAQIAVLGIAMLATNKKTAETAEAKRIDKGSFDSALSVTARGLQDALERALDFHAAYLGLDDGGSVKVNRDFENMAMDPLMLTAYVGAVANAGLPPRILLAAMQEGGLIGQDTDLEELEAEMMANASAIADQKAQEQAATFGKVAQTAVAAGKSPDSTTGVDIVYGEDGKPSKLVKTKAAA